MAVYPPPRASVLPLFKLDSLMAKEITYSSAIRTSRLRVGDRTRQRPTIRPRARYGVPHHGRPRQSDTQPTPYGTRRLPLEGPVRNQAETREQQRWWTSFHANDRHGTQNENQGERR